MRCDIRSKRECGLFAMGNVFGRQGRVTSRVTDQDRAILQLKQQRDKLKQYQKKITLQLEKERRLAKRLLKDGKKEQALLLLKKKRYQDQLLDKTDIQIANLECMVMSIEEVERILEETQEAIEYQKQIDELLAGFWTAEDEDAVLAELEAITQGEDITLPELPTDPLSAVPTGETERKEAQIKPEREMLAA
ncbi:charged multivesicular body protein 6 isoform X2 [Labeo rohita]|uniref:charged multivesicular body protein 6 isoform X2 n=1 Tax=Labeo rohita TaxID=84645 RepID=UPI0021E221E9|nr:charged multivesicular body protein 6 isoform X2 [Labeo rohita]